MQKHLRSLFCAAAACALVLLSACASGDTGSSPARMPDSPALAQAKSQLSNIDSRISQSESSLRQLSPPIRFTDKGVTTFDVEKQRQYELNRDRLDRQIRDLRNERTIWDLRVSQIIQQESLMTQQRAAMPVQQSGQPTAPMMGMPPAMLTLENPARAQARDKVRDISFQISQSESVLRALSPPTRTTANGTVTFDVEKQRQYDLERARIDTQLRDLRADRTLWELRVNQLSQ